MSSHKSYDDALRAAVAKSRLCKCDVAIRKWREYGRTVYSVSGACRNDSDYARAEIVRYGDPLPAAVLGI